MANLDTREKRASSVAISLYAMGPSIQAGSAGLDDEDRQIAGYGYSAIAVGSPVTIFGSARKHEIEGFTTRWRDYGTIRWQVRMLACLLG